jgi:anti-sigma factor ChrR (cupin superfamily)
MMQERTGHPDDEELETYALGVLAEDAVPRLEQHLLICHGCQDRMAEMDAYVQGMQGAARELRAKAKSKKSASSTSPG